MAEKPDNAGPGEDATSATIRSKTLDRCRLEMLSGGILCPR